MNRPRIEMIFFDLDGPILDVSEKYYRVYKDCLMSLGGSPLTKEEYWEKKRSKTPDRQILGLKSEADYAKFKEARRAAIETDLYWKLDTLQAGAVDRLSELSQRYPLYLVTLRENPAALRDQLSAQNIMSFFKKIMSGPGKKEDRWKTKVEFVRSEFGNDLPQALMVGDTETDILAGQELGFSTIAVTNGIRNRALLQSYRPNQIIQSINELTVALTLNLAK